MPSRLKSAPLPAELTTVAPLSHPSPPSATEEGFTILEVVIALGVFALLIAGLATSTFAGLNLVGRSSARQSATQVASQEIERLRAEGYAKLGHPAASAPLFSADPDNPNHALNSTSTEFTVPELAGGPEVLVVGASPPYTTDAGPTTVAREQQRFRVYRYVTWVGDTSIPPNTLKRLTVIAQWSGKDTTGKPNRVVLATVFSAGEIRF